MRVGSAEGTVGSGKFWAVASPLVGLGQLRSAIWAVGFKASLDDSRMNALASETHKAAKTISQRIQDQLMGRN